MGEGLGGSDWGSTGGSFESLDGSFFGFGCGSGCRVGSAPFDGFGVGSGIRSGIVLPGVALGRLGADWVRGSADGGSTGADGGGSSNPAAGTRALGGSIAPIATPEQVVQVGSISDTSLGREMKGFRIQSPQMSLSCLLVKQRSMRLSDLVKGIGSWRSM